MLGIWKQFKGVERGTTMVGNNREMRRKRSVIYGGKRGKVVERGTTMAENNREMRRKRYEVVECGTSMAGNSRGNCEGRSSLRLGIARRFDRSDTRERKPL